MQSNDNSGENTRDSDDLKVSTGAESESAVPAGITPDPNEASGDPNDASGGLNEAASGPNEPSDHGKNAGKPEKKKKKKKNQDGLGTTRGIETMFRTSYRVHMELSSLADTKANIMISINGLIISIIIASISPKIDTNPWLLIPTTVMLLGCLVSIVYAVISARPRVSSDLISLDDVRSNKANILFFGHFSRLSQDDFVTGMSELLSNSTTLYQNMIRDIYSLGNVLTRKFELLRVSYNAFMIGLVAGILIFIFVYVWIVSSLDSGSDSIGTLSRMLEVVSGGGTA